MTGRDRTDLFRWGPWAFLGGVYAASAVPFVLVGFGILSVLIVAVGVFCLWFFLVEPYLVWKTGAQPLPEEEFAALYREYERVASRLEVETPPRLLVADLDAPTAFVVGRGGRGCIVLSTDLLRELDYDELVAVLASELAWNDDRNGALIVLGECSAVALGVSVSVLFALTGSVPLAALGGALGVAIRTLVLSLVETVARNRGTVADQRAIEVLGDSDGLNEAVRTVETERGSSETGISTPAKLRSFHSQGGGGVTRFLTGLVSGAHATDDPDGPLGRS
jgi:heat shock protein HtpX